MACIFDEEDRKALIAEVRRLGAMTALEFGPGESTQALLDAGCLLVDTFEHSPKWRNIAIDRFAHRPEVYVHGYENLPVVDIFHGNWNLAFVDSPAGQGKRRVFHRGQEDCSRYNTVSCALERAPVVFLHDAWRDGEQGTLNRLEAEGYCVEIIETRKGIARITHSV